MTNSFYKQIVDSFHFNEKKDFEAICSILDKKVYEKRDVAVIGEDPYLLVLIFLCLIRHDGINIHILNPKEESTEVQRLLNIINPDITIWSGIWFKDQRGIIIDGETISNEKRYDVDYNDKELNFNIITYSPYPTKIYNISSELFIAMLNALMNDLYKLDLIDEHDYGCIPFLSNNPDYLLYLVALKILGNGMTLPSEDDINLPIDHKDTYKAHNKAKTLFIPKKEFVDIYETKVSSIFEKPFVFRLYLKWVWLVNLLIQRRLKRLLKGFSNVVVIGILDNMYMIDLLKNQSVKFYSIFPMSSALQFGSISRSLTSISSLGIERFIQYDNYFTLSYTLFTDDKTVFHLNNNNLLFLRSTIHENNQNVYQYEVIADKDNMFYNKGFRIFPESLEKVINSNPLIRNCVLLTFNKKVILMINPNMDILDSIRINQGMFNGIIQKQIDTLNEKLPDQYHIGGFVIGTNLIELNRLGDIVRYPFNTINKM